VENLVKRLAVVNVLTRPSTHEPEESLHITKKIQRKIDAVNN
jgi:hypothetical protein